MNLLFENWEIITGTIGAVVAFFGGLKLQKYNNEKAHQEAEGERINNIDRILKINGEQIDLIQVQFQKRIDNLQEYISEVEQINNKLEKMIGEQKSIISKQNRFLGIYIKKYGKIEEDAA